jgi:hypothetical protein
MAIVTNSLFDRHSIRIQEVLNKNITVFLSAIDPIWRDTIATSQGVGPASDIGRDLLVIKTFLGSFTGVLEQGDLRGDPDLYGDLTRHLGQQVHEQQINQSYPDPTTGPNATPYQLAFGMRSMPANIMLTLGEKTAEATPAFIGQVLAPKMMGFARMMSHTLCNYFYLSQNDDYRLCSITNVSATATVTIGAVNAYRFSFEPNNNACARFARGQRIDIYDSNGTNRINDDQAAAADQGVATRQQLIVESVAPLKNVVTCISRGVPTAVGDWEDSPTNGQLVMYANSKAGATAMAQSSGNFTGIAGINSWLKPGDANGATNNNQNTLLGTAEAHASKFINVNLNPEFMSFLKAVNGVLTEHKLRQYLARVHAAWEPHGHVLDCLIASDGVWLAYESQKIGQYRLDRTNRTSSLMNEGSQKGFKLTFDGRTYTGYTSHVVESQTLYGLKKGGGNWKRYVPPSPAGVSNMPEADQYVPFEFVGAAITGGSSNQLPIYDSSGNITLVTEGSQLPGRIRMQLAPDNPAMMKLTGLTEDRVYGDDGS